MNDVRSFDWHSGRTHPLGVGCRHASAHPSTVHLLSIAAARARHAILVMCLGVFAGLVSSPTAWAQEPAPWAAPAISEDAGAAVAQMAKTVSARQLSFTARTIRVYLDGSGQPLHIFHTMNVVMRRPDRLKVDITGDDGSRNLFYDGKAVVIFSPDSNVYGTTAAPGGIASAVNEILDKLNVDFPLVNIFAVSTDLSLLKRVAAGWQAGTADIDGIECRHLFFYLRGGTDAELWVENNDAAIPHRLVVTYRLLPGQPSFIAEITNWHSGVQSPDSVFAFKAPAQAKQIEFSPAILPAQQGRP